MYLALYNEPLFPEPIERWPHGPVVREIYYKYSNHKAAPIPPPARFNLNDYLEQEREHLAEIYRLYGQYSAWMLQNMFHETAPWINHGTNEEIPRDEMREYFRAYLR